MSGATRVFIHALASLPAEHAVGVPVVGLDALVLFVQDEKPIGSALGVKPVTDPRRGFLLLVEVHEHGHLPTSSMGY